jgi:glycerophosphoryl diester phosphodiesterase
VTVWRWGPIVVGHRGGRGESWPPENTMAAFEQARRQGAAAVELDVRVCAGGVVVVCHDPTLARITGNRDARRVSDVPLGDLRAMGVPTLDEALSWANAAGVAVNVEMKHDTPHGVLLVLATVRTARTAGADVLLSSFDPRLLAMAWVRAPDLPRALIVHAGQRRWADALQGAVRRPFVGWLHLERAQVRRSVLASAARRGLKVGVWTVNDPEDAVNLVRWGVTSIITDDPGAILPAVTRSGPAR